MSKKNSVLLAAIAALFAATTLFVGLPAMIWHGNEREFSFPFLNVLWTFWPYFVGLLLVVPGVSVLLPTKVSRQWGALAVVLASYVWAHGVFQTHDFGGIDGLNWSVSVPDWHIALDAVIIVVSVILLWVLSIRASSIVIGLMLFLTVGMVLEARPLLSRSEWNAVSDKNWMAEVGAFSREANALIVLMDTMTSDVFEQVVNQSPSRKRALEGFILYRDTVGAAPSTYLSMPTIHAGKVFDGKGDLSSFFNQSIQTDSVLNKVANAGYQSVLINPIRTCPSNVKCLDLRSALVGDRTSARIEGLTTLDLVLFRVAPLALKGRVYNEGEWILRKWLSGGEFVQMAVEGNYFLRQLAKSVTSTSSSPTLKFIHLMTTHPPYVYEEGCRYVGRELPGNRANFAIQVGCSIDNFVVLLESLKKQGIYDKTAIILLADHGNRQIPTDRIPETDGLNQIVASANPTFAIKPLGRRDEFRTADGEIHVGDFGATLCDLLQVCKADFGVSALTASDGRSRTFIDYIWQHAFWDTETIEGMTAYEVRGPVFAANSWLKEVPIALGATIDFKNTGNSGPYTIGGWSSSEPWGTWTVGSIASVWMAPKERRPFKLTVSAHGFVAAGPMMASVRVNNRRVGRLSFSSAQPAAEVSFPIPAEVLAERMLKIDFLIDDPKSPSEVGLSADVRELGIGVRWIRLDPLPG